MSTPKPKFSLLAEDLTKRLELITVSTHVKRAPLPAPTVTAEDLASLDRLLAGKRRLH
jgi:alkanesulfonate monooxygenase SsuD/methylene tetrahydromethanopterin reductase-like flavin-dependent oxidoreductase (luciferase family)